MQSIASENNLSETAFVDVASIPFLIRWFSPIVEVDLCGHATLASARILFDDYLPQDSSQISFSAKRGALSAFKRDNLIYLGFPAEKPTTEKKTRSSRASIRRTARRVIQRPRRFPRSLREREGHPRHRPGLRFTRRTRVPGRHRHSAGGPSRLCLSIFRAAHGRPGRPCNRLYAYAPGSLLGSENWQNRGCGCTAIATIRTPLLRVDRFQSIHWRPHKKISAGRNIHLARRAKT